MANHAIKVKDRRVSFRLSTDKYLDVAAAAKVNNMTVSGFICSRLDLNKDKLVVPAKENQKVMLEIMKLYSAIGKATGLMKVHISQLDNYEINADNIAFKNLLNEYLNLKDQVSTLMLSLNKYV